MSTQIGSFKGKPTITLEPDSDYPFSFGLNKARMIAANIADIQAFVHGGETRVAPSNGHRPGAAVIGGKLVMPRSGRCEDAPCCGCCD